MTRVNGDTSASRATEVGGLDRSVRLRYEPSLRLALAQVWNLVWASDCTYAAAWRRTIPGCGQ
jgi:hypothetical protein